ncbi:DUF2313 domain-containing protein [Paenibacillus sp. LMG 31461]|uniref:DUF2313 domain-containing protein n=1 Tax=Paenibacillus plantarum TaxID=2654975 RepID=A0ABX1XIZ1_9BACL|nr:putative phage tail protein [Paenibacillus plantarum]NOU68396.1 DUF2313 domain-containing protein [Paenibacillus plantarum]
MSDYKLNSIFGKQMLEVLPDLYEEIYETRVILETEGQEFDNLSASVSDAFSQAFVDQATWGLINWENILGITTDITKPNNQRRSVIKSKIRGTGTVNMQLLHNVIASYEHGTVEIIVQPAAFQINIRFIDTAGTPPNFIDIQRAVEEIKPAHLVVLYSFRYLIWNELNEYNPTWDELDAIGFTWDQFEIWVHNSNESSLALTFCE